MQRGGKLDTVYDGKHIQLARRGTWEFVSRRGVSGIVGIIAVTDAEELILVEQYRAPVDKDVIELPAGLAGDVPGHEMEELEVAARRELLEETGYEAQTMRRVAEGTASAGITDEIITLFMATGIKKTGAGEGDGSEKITVHLVPLKEVQSWLSSKQAKGKLVDLKIYSALHFAHPPA